MVVVVSSAVLFGGGFALACSGARPQRRRRPAGDLTGRESRSSRHGGRLYLWEKTVGDEFAVDRMATGPPSNVDFEEVPCRGFSLLLDARLDLAEEIRISLRRFPRHHLHVTWDGQTWGWRGVSAGPLSGP